MAFFNRRQDYRQNINQRQNMQRPQQRPAIQKSLSEMHREKTGYYDPSVRFEPFGGNNDIKNENQINKNNIENKTDSQNIIKKDEQDYTVKSKLKEIYQGEKNSIKFYNNMLELELNSNQKEFLNSIILQKENNIKSVNKIYTELIMAELENNEQDIAKIENYKEAFSFALLQEVELLRDLNNLTVNIGGKINPLINSKIADIAGIIGIMGLY